MLQSGHGPSIRSRRKQIRRRFYSYAYSSSRADNKRVWNAIPAQIVCNQKSISHKIPMQILLTLQQSLALMSVCGNTPSASALVYSCDSTMWMFLNRVHLQPNPVQTHSSHTYIVETLTVFVLHMQ